MDHSPLQTSVRDLLFILFKRKWSILAILTIATLSAVVWLWGIREDLYSASAKVLVKLGHEQAPPPTLVTGVPQVVGYRYQEVNSEVEILQNSELLLAVIDDFGLDKPAPEPPMPTGTFPRLRWQAKRYAKQIKTYIDELMIRYGLRERLTPREMMLYTLERALAVHGQKDSNIFVAQLTMPYRRSVAPILNRLIDRYLDYRIRLYKTAGIDFFRDRADQSTAELRQAESALQQYEMAGRISNIGRQQEELLQQIALAETALRDAERALADASSKVQRLESELRAAEPNFGKLGDFQKDSFPETILRQIADLQRERERLRLTELDTGERIQNNRSQFQVLVDMLAANLRSQRAEKEADYRLRRNALDQLRSELAAVHRRQMEWEALKRKSRTNEETAAFYRRKLEEASSTLAMEHARIGNVVVIQRATDPALPSSMRKTKLLAVCLVVALFLALAWVAVAEFFDHRIFTTESLERHLNAPVISVVRTRRRLLGALKKVNAASAAMAARAK